MRALLQRVSEATVEVEGAAVGSIGRGWLIFLAVTHGDAVDEVEILARKVAALRGFEDRAGRTNLAAADVGAEMLVVSQFTLLADLSRGRRPSFIGAAPPARARGLINQFAGLLRQMGFRVAEGTFGAHMQVKLVNDGPFTIWLDTETLSG